MIDYNQLQKLASEADAPLGLINAAAAELIESGLVSLADMAEVLAPLKAASNAVKAIADWGRAAAAMPQSTPATPAGGPPRLPRLTGAALRTVLTGVGLVVDGKYAIPGVANQDTARDYVQAYRAGYYYNPAVTALAVLSDDQLAETKRTHATPADWYNSIRLRPSFIATLPADWPALLALAGR